MGLIDARDVLQTGSIKHTSLRMTVYVMLPSAWIGMWHAFTRVQNEHSIIYRKCHLAFNCSVANVQ